MSQRDKALDRLARLPKDYRWEEACRLLGHLDYTQLQGDGSRVKFFHDDGDMKYVISLHRPHPTSIMKPGAVRDLYEHLKARGVTNGK